MMAAGHHHPGGEGGGWGRCENEGSCTGEKMQQQRVGRQPPSLSKTALQGGAAPPPCSPSAMALLKLTSKNPSPANETQRSRICAGDSWPVAAWAPAARARDSRVAGSLTWREGGRAGC
jgi:hypothetical protein